MTLILFDIDGTLLHAGEAGQTAIRRALSSFTDRSLSFENVSFSGRTDPAIFEDILLENDLPTTDSFIKRAIDQYVDTIESLLSPEDVEVLPGVPSLLEALDAHNDLHLGLLTGNVEPVAYKKLSCAGLAEYFPFGSFGSDHADRLELPTIAAQRASAALDCNIRPDEHLVIVGDTVHDIRCGQAVGATVVSVCTGRYTRETLTRLTPHLILNTLDQKDAFLDSVLENTSTKGIGI